MREVANLFEGLGADHGADGDRIIGIEHLTRLVRGQEPVDHRLIEHVHTFYRVGEDESVHAHHHRHREFLGQAKSLHVQIGGLLVGLGEELNPPRVAHGHRVAVIVPNVDGGADGAIGERHHDRQSQPRRVVDRLNHEEQPLTRRRGVGARTGRRGPDGDRHCREL